VAVCGRKTLRNELMSSDLPQFLTRSMDGFKEKNRKKQYDRISRHATHATPNGFKLTLKDRTVLSP
jgi:hypothetical protein